MNDFESRSKQVANDFLQSIIFIDDKAYKRESADPKHDFDAQTISIEFAKEGKICSVFQPMSKDDINSLPAIAAKADVTVIDWEIILPESEGADDDDDDDEIKGKHTKEIIKNLLNSKRKRNNLNLIVIYTGEVDLLSISEEILSYLKSNEINDFVISDEDLCCVYSNNCKIIIRAKSNGGEGQGKHLPALRNKMLTYEELPDFIICEFSKMTNGLLPNFALQSLTAIRENVFQILNIFNKELDSAYLTHQSLLNNTDDANELLVDLIGDTFTSILRTKNLNNNLNQDVTNAWLEHYIKDEDKPKFNSKGKLSEETFTRNKALLTKLLKSSPDVLKKFKNVLDTVGVSKASTEKSLKKYAINMFHDNDEHENKNRKFALLCQHKDLIHYDDHIPTLSLGTVVKSNIEPHKYLLCIQQRCDSVRLSKNENRRFLFLSLSIVDGSEKFNFLAPSGQKLKLDNSTYDIRTVKFSGSEAGTVNAVKEEATNKSFFEPLHYSEVIPDSEVVLDLEKSREKFEFVFELKDLYAQRVVAEYSASLARVGVDEPEWVRLSY